MSEFDVKSKKRVPQVADQKGSFPKNRISLRICPPGNNPPIQLMNMGPTVWSARSEANIFAVEGWGYPCRLVSREAKQTFPSPK